MQSHTILRLSSEDLQRFGRFLRDGGRQPGEYPPTEKRDELRAALEAQPYVGLVAVAADGVESPVPVMEVPAVLAIAPSDGFRLPLALRAPADGAEATAQCLAFLAAAAGVEVGTAAAMQRAVTDVQGYNPLDTARFTWPDKNKQEPIVKALEAHDGGAAHPKAPAVPLARTAARAIIHAAVHATASVAPFRNTAGFEVTDADRAIAASDALLDAWYPSLDRRCAAQQTTHRGGNGIRTTTKVGSATLRSALWRSLIAAAQLPTELHVADPSGDAGAPSIETAPQLPQVPGDGPRWGAQLRLPAYVHGGGAGSRVNVRFWAAVILNLEAFTRNGAWLFARVPANSNTPENVAGRRSTNGNNSGGAVSLVAMGDWGEDGHGLRQFEAGVKALLPALPTAPAAMLALGDNFYPSGITTVYDRRLMYQYRNRFHRRRRGSSEPPHALEALPWLLALGNHDYNGDAGTQIALSDASSANANGLWRLQGDDPCFGPNRNYSVAFHGADFDVHFFVVDLNAVQFSVRRRIPGIVKRYETEDLPWLRSELAASVAAEKASGRTTWRIVAAHQPMFTNGRGHANEARCLQSASYIAIGKPDEGPLPGLDLQPTFDEFNVHAFVAGHEHVMQITRKSYRHGDCMHAVVGAPVETHYYKGPLTDPNDMMVDAAYRGQCGFGTLTATAAELAITFWGLPRDGSSAKPSAIATEKIVRQPRRSQPASGDAAEAATPSA